MECRPRHSAFRGILLLLLCALLATWVKTSRGISARNPQALDLRAAPCMRQGCRQAANWKRARRSRRATKTCRNEDKQRQADTIGSRALCVPPHECCVLSAPRLQVHSHRCPLAGRKMHTHWLHVYRCSQTGLKAFIHRPGFRCKHAGAHRPGSRYIRAVRMGSGSVYTYPPPVTRPNPWAQDIQAKLVIRSAGPVPSPG